jgi:hypothetical protein
MNGDIVITDHERNPCAVRSVSQPIDHVGLHLREPDIRSAVEEQMQPTADVAEPELDLIAQHLTSDRAGIIYCHSEIGTVHAPVTHEPPSCLVLQPHKMRLTRPLASREQALGGIRAVDGAVVRVAEDRTLIMVKLDTPAEKLPPRSKPVDLVPYTVDGEQSRLKVFGVSLQ